MSLELLCFQGLIVIGLCICLKLMRLVGNYFKVFGFANYIIFRNSFWILFVISMTAKFFFLLIGTFDLVRFYLVIPSFIILVYCFKFLFNKQITNQNIFNKLLQLTQFIYSSKYQNEVFNPIVLDWQEEYFEALGKKEIWKARWINVRYTYAFIGAMIQKSPIGDIFELVIKIIKVAK